MWGSKEETIPELAPPEKTQVSTAGSLLRKIQPCQKVKSQLTDRASAQPGHIRARLVRVLRTAVAEIRIPL